VRKMEKKVYSKEDIVRDLINLGVKKGDLLNIKCSMKSIGNIEGGARTLIDALIEVVGEEGTIVTDSFIRMYKENVAQEKPLSNEKSPSYCGVLANEMIEYPNSFRSNHPVQKFAAIGALAKMLTEEHTPDSYAYDVLRVMCMKGGKNLKIGTDEKVPGVGTTHVAIGIMGFRQLRPVIGVHYIDKNSEKKFFKINWAGICGKGLIKFIPHYLNNGAVISEGNVGNAEAKITDMMKTLKIELDLLKKDPTFFMCKNEDCVDCQLTWEFSKRNKYMLFLKYIFRGKFRNAFRVLKTIFTKHEILPNDNKRVSI